MTLAVYKKKRSFHKTPEPSGKKSAGNEKLRFVVQKHDASRLHYDFRLELKGVLKSWAVPKGPSLNPADKRLAMMVEDHPFDYKDFEGIIPEGNYGAGTVIVWDEGTYEPIEDISGKNDQEKVLAQQLKSGSLKIVLHGKKLKGEFALVHTKQSENSWLMIKHRDAYASTSDVTKKDKSVKSGKSLFAIEKSAVKKPTVKKTAAPAKKSKKSTVKKKSALKKTIKPRKGLPENIPPMLATLSQPFEEEGWIYEIKWDGYRAVAYVNGTSSRLLSRNNKSFDEKFYPVIEAVKQWNTHAVVDGEIVVIQNSGASSFGSLQNWRSEADGELAFYVFDMLWLEGKDLTQQPLLKRREILREQLPKDDKGLIRFSNNFDASASELLEKAKKLGLEGIIAKKEDSLYYPGERTREWLKMKMNKRHEVVIGGYTKNEGSSKTFSSLLVGVYEKGKLLYTGKIGTGFSSALQQELMKKFKPFLRKSSPFDVLPDVNKPSRFRPDPPHADVYWLKPVFVCEVSYTEITSDGVMRHPSFEGMREDKSAKDVGRETVISPASLAAAPKKAPAKSILKPLSAGNERKSLLNPSEATQVKKINQEELKFTNLNKVYWRKENITKRDLLNYYYQAAPYILPYLVNRPQSLNRYPNGYQGKSFYQKDITGKVPDWIANFPYYSNDEEQEKNFLVCTNEASLLYMANMGCIEMNPWSSTIQKPDHPSWCIIDLDPAKNNFNQVIEAANLTHQILESAAIPSWCKTSGSTGLHIYIPLGAKYTYEQSKEFARLIVTIVQRELPAFTSIERQVSKRKGKMYLDFLQNRPQATLAAPYSVRPKAGATVSMPLFWEEVKKGMTIQDFHLKNVMPMLKERGDIFKGVLGKGMDMQRAIKKIQAEWIKEDE